jgi:sRNA-binding protein
MNYVMNLFQQRRMKEKKKREKKKVFQKKETVNRTRASPLTARGQPDSLRPCEPHREEEKDVRATDNCPLHVSFALCE